MRGSTHDAKIYTMHCNSVEISKHIAICRVSSEVTFSILSMVCFRLEPGI